MRPAVVRFANWLQMRTASRLCRRTRIQGDVQQRPASPHCCDHFQDQGAEHHTAVVVDWQRLTQLPEIAFTPAALSAAGEGTGGFWQGVKCTWEGSDAHSDFIGISGSDARTVASWVKVPPDF